jgi:hypothetical protein
VLAACTPEGKYYLGHYVTHNITQTYNTKINKYLELPVAMRNLWSLEKKSILPLIQGDRRKTFNAVSYLFFMRFE